MAQTIRSDLTITGLNTLYWKGVKLENVSSFNLFCHHEEANCTIRANVNFSDVLLAEIRATGIDIRKGRK